MCPSANCSPVLRRSKAAPNSRLPTTRKRSSREGSRRCVTSPADRGIDNSTATSTGSSTTTSPKPASTSADQPRSSPGYAPTRRQPLPRPRGKRSAMQRPAASTTSPPRRPPSPTSNCSPRCGFSTRFPPGSRQTTTSPHSPAHPSTISPTRRLLLDWSGPAQPDCSPGQARPPRSPETERFSEDCSNHLPPCQSAPSHKPARHASPTCAPRGAATKSTSSSRQTTASSPSRSRCQQQSTTLTSRTCTGSAPNSATTAST